MVIGSKNSMEYNNGMSNAYLLQQVFYQTILHLVITEVN